MPESRLLEKTSLSPFQIVLVYAGFGALWILCSDYLVAQLFPSELFPLVSTLKGWLFILVTSLVLIVLLHRYQARVERNVRHLQEIVDNLPCHFYAFDREGRSVLLNRMFLRLLNSSLDEALGKERGELGMDPESVAEHRANDLLVFETGQPLVTEETNREADGIHRYLTAKFPLTDDAGGVKAICGVSTDITARQKAEAALRESEKRLQQLGDNLPDSYVYQCTVGQDGTTVFTYLSAGFEMLHGLTREEALSDPFTLIRQVEPGQRAELVALEKLSAEQMSDFEMKLHVQRNDGEWRWMRIRSRPRREADGRVIWDGVATDITGQMLAEEAVQALSREWQNTFDAIRDAIALLDRDFRILHCNRAFVELSGSDPTDIPGRHCWELMHQGHEPMTGCPYARMQQSLRSEHAVHRHGDRWLEVRVDPIIGEDGTMCGAIHVIADITDRKQAEDLLAEKERTLRLLFNEMQSGFALHEIICDAAGTPVDYRFLMVNQAFEQLTGLKRTEIIGKTVREIMPGIEPAWIERYGQVALTGESTQFEMYSREIDRHFGVRSWRPEAGKFAVLFSDISSRCQAERELKSTLSELEERNAELEQFSYSVSHDLKTPLVTIGGFAGQLRTDLAQGNVENLGIDLDFIESAATQMGNLLDNLLHLARSGRSISEPQPVDLAKVISEALELTRGVLDKSTVRVEIADGLPWVQGDVTRLREVFQNLLENAAKFSGGETSRLVEVGAKAPEGDQILCWVRDSGKGIPPQYLERIFGLFERLDENLEGTGVGLALSRRIIEKHGGRIWAESAGEGQGSTFFISLPTAQPVTA